MGQVLHGSATTTEMKTAIELGIADAWAELAKLQKRMDAKEITSGDIFGTREYLKNNYLYRMIAAIIGIFGNSKQEAMYPLYAVDVDRKKLDGANRYTLYFEPSMLPPVMGFWSLTMYELPASLLFANSLKRYLLNSPMLPQFKLDADGRLTFLSRTRCPARTRRQTGCLRQKDLSSWRCACIGRSPTRSKEGGALRNSKEWFKTTAILEGWSLLELRR